MQVEVLGLAQQILETIKIKVNHALTLLSSGKLELAKRELESILRVLQGVFEEKLYKESEN